MPHDEIAAHYVLGALSPEARQSLDVTRLHNKALDGTIARLEAKLAPLAGPARDATIIPTGLWSRISAALETEQDAMAGKRVEPFGQGGWVDYAPGIELKPLWSERAMLLRCQPGAQEPEHDQHEDEHVIVLAGDLVMGGRGFGIGDYLFIPSDARHAHMHTVNGCILFMQYIAK